MRSVPPKPILKSAPLKMFDENSEDRWGCLEETIRQAWPVPPAMEVKVPHSCAIRAGFGILFRALAG